MFKSKKMIALVACLFLMSMNTGCMTLLKPQSGTINVTSMPAGATVVVDGYELGTTPLKARVKNNQLSSGVLEVKKAGYKTSKTNLNYQADEYFIGDCLFLLLGIIPGAVAIGVDVVNGYLYKFQPNSVEIKLEKEAKKETKKESKKETKEETKKE